MWARSAAPGYPGVMVSSLWRTTEISDIVDEMAAHGWCWPSQSQAEMPAQHTSCWMSQLFETLDKSEPTIFNWKDFISLFFFLFFFFFFPHAKTKEEKQNQHRNQGRNPTAKAQDGKRLLSIQLHWESKQLKSLGLAIFHCGQWGWSWLHEALLRWSSAPRGAHWAAPTQAVSCSHKPYGPP